MVLNEILLRESRSGRKILARNNLAWMARLTKDSVVDRVSDERILREILLRGSASGRKNLAREVEGQKIDVESLTCQRGKIFLHASGEKFLEARRAGKPSPSEARVVR